MLALCAAEELCRGLVCGPCLLQPVIGLGVVALGTCHIRDGHDCLVFLQHDDALAVFPLFEKLHLAAALLGGVAAFPAFQLDASFLLFRNHYGAAFFAEFDGHCVSLLSNTARLTFIVLQGNKQYITSL